MLALALFTSAPPARTQTRDAAALSEAEIEQLRDTAYVAADRVGVFIKFLDARANSIHDLAAKPRRPGRETDLHDLFEQFTSIADELNDNLDDYGPRHRDIRKQLPKLIDATARWSTTLRSVPDDDAYNLSRKLALESVRDIREEATRLVDDQKTWFAAHPPSKDERQQNESPR